EVERDLARGVLDQTEADRTRTEISRRLLTADATGRAALTDAPKGLSRVAAAVLGLGLLSASGWLYLNYGAPGYGDVPRAERVAISDERRANRPGQLEAEAAAPAPENLLDQFDDQTRDLIQDRRAAAFEKPEDLATWDVLSRTEAAIGAYDRATRAQERVVALKGDEVTPADIETLLDLMVAATAGYVSPEAEAVAFQLLQMDPDNAPAQYYTGLMYAQNDRPDMAFPIWRKVVEESPRDTLHWNFAAGQIGDVAFMLGVDYALPDQRGPSNEQIADAQNMTEEDRAAMIQGMVQQLAERLATDGGPPQDWARLVTALGVLGEDEKARQVVDEAEIVFGGDVQAVGIIRAAAQEAGILE
ncbi:MAG: c-type cytochrome biogenesis protein CcmI, partial [Octadecabacter sp.]|nr:c-type cytochrome biogenesis protein CcmI [Octadecabacter sp.]